MYLKLSNGHTVLSINLTGNPAGEFQDFALLVDTVETLDMLSNQFIV